MGKIIGFVAWAVGVGVFYLVFLNDVLTKFQVAQTDASRLATMGMFAGIWALIVHTVMYFLPTSVQAKLG